MYLMYLDEMKWNEMIVYFLLSKKDYFYKWEKIKNKWFTKRLQTLNLSRSYPGKLIPHPPSYNRPPQLTIYVTYSHMKQLFTKTTNLISCLVEISLAFEKGDKAKYFWASSKNKYKVDITLCTFSIFPSVCFTILTSAVIGTSFIFCSHVF